MTLPFENDTSRIVKRLAKQNMKANRRTSISIMVAILIASTFLCSLCTFVQSYWNQSVQQEIAAYGDWDAQLLEIHAGQLDLIQNNENVQTIMVKGDNQTALLPAASGLPYRRVLPWRKTFGHWIADSVFDCRSFDVDAGCDFYGVHSGISVIRAGSLYCSGTNGHQWDLQGGFQKNPQGHYCRSLKG